MNRVAVLMSTYNGEAYLREQLDTILRQTDVVVTLFVRDDGSSDRTKDILAEYVEHYDAVKVEFAENVGVGNSFMNLLYSVPADFDYYAFADQDDIWLPEKLSEAIKKLHETGALLYTSNQECVDREGKLLKMRYDETVAIHLLPEEILQSNMVAGCTMVFTNSMYKILVAPEHRPSAALLYNRIHDVWVAFVASLYGGITYDSRSFIRYRQHANNVVGIAPRRGERWKKVKDKKLRNGRSLLAREACEKFSDLTERHPLVAMSALTDKHKGKIDLLKNKKAISDISGECKFWLSLKILLGWY